MPQRKPEVTRRTAAGIPYELTRKKVKRLNLHIRRDGTVAVSIPWSYAVGFADAFVTEQAQWIREAVSRQLRRNARNDQPLPSQAEALACFTAMSDKVYPAFAGVLGGQKPTIKVRDMTSRWGVCYMKRRQITFALQLYNMPPAAQIYVVVHEYCHFLQCACATSRPCAMTILSSACPSAACCASCCRATARNSAAPACTTRPRSAARTCRSARSPAPRA